MSAELLTAWNRVVRRCGSERAIVQGTDGVGATFRELDERASAWIARAAPAGIDLRGRPIVFGLPNGIAWLEVFLGLLRAGAVAAPVDPGEPEASRGALAESIGATGIWDGTMLRMLPGRRRFRDPDICFLKLTSGSTGAPQPLAFRSAQLLADGRQIMATMRFGRSDLNYALIPFGHSYGLGNLVIPLIASGVPVVCGTAPLPHAIVSDFDRWQPSVFPGVPVIWRGLAAAGARLTGLRLAISAGAPLAPETAGAFQAGAGVAIHSFYGSSETGGIAYDRTGRAALVGGVGRAMSGVLLTPGPGGRLAVASAAVVTHGNRRRRGRIGSWLMPDRVAIDARGDIVLGGRRGPTVKISGRRVSLIEVETILRKLDGVRDQWVGVGDGPEPVLGAALATTKSVAVVRSELQAMTAPWKIPKRIAVVESLPVTSRGKIDAGRVRALVFGGR
ncbi:MAG TPA: class I adenylate-forming enzyme family protein [Candidatus Didemnitutus sp.]|jgi:acyl-coenzyme A synthetase/AMP-(fatty) acid ligase